MIVAIVTRANRLHLKPEGGEIEEIAPGQFWFGWTFDDLFALGTGEHDIQSREPIDLGIEIDTTDLTTDAS